jgi:hypothetical protein
MSVRIRGNRRQLRGLSGVEEEREIKRAKVEEIAVLSEKADTDIIRRAVALAELMQLGAVTCADLDAYNKVALEVYRANILVFQTMIKAGADRSKLVFPFQPPLFTPQPKVPIECIQNGTNCNVSVESPCLNGALNPDTRIFADTPEVVALFDELQPSSNAGLEGLGLGPAVILGIKVGLWAIGFLTVAGAATWMSIAVIDRMNGSELDKAKSEYNKVILKIGAAKTEARLACMNGGQSDVDCRRIVEESFPTPARPEGILEGVTGTVIKLGALFLAGSFLYRKIQE